MIYDPKIELGYQVRDDPVSFQLPYVKPVLASGDNIYTRCGPFKYTVTIASAKSGTYEPIPFNIIPESETDPKSAKVEVQTTDQDYAIDKSKYEAALKADPVS